MRRRLFLVVAAVLFVAASREGLAQFGQNKFSRDVFEWKVYSSPHFDIHYYGETELFLDTIVSYAEGAYLQASKELDHELRFRVPLIVYKNHGDFERTNIALEEITEGVGAFAEPMRYRMVLPMDQPPDKLYALIGHELTHIFQYSIFFEGYLGRALRANPPIWFVEGMASYVAQDEDNLDRMVIRDAVVNNILPPIRAFSGLSFLAYRFGHAVFDFIEQEYGKEGLRNFIFEYRKVLLTNNLAKALKESFGLEPDEFDRRFNRYLRKKYFPVLLEKKGPEDYGREIGIKRDGIFTFSPTISPSGELIAALASPKAELDLVVLPADGGKVVRNVTKGWTNAYEYLVAEAFAGKRDLSWSPAGDSVAVFARKEHHRILLVFDALTGRRTASFALPGIAQGASPAFSPDGTKIAFEGNSGGVVDIFEIDVATGAVRNVTQDDFFDANPWYAADGASLLYNRRIGSEWKIFSADLTDASRKTQLTFGKSSDIQPSYSRDGKTVFFSSDRGGYGVFNVHALDLASGEIRQYTDVVGGCFAPVEMAPRDGEPVLVFTSFFEGTFRLFRMPLRQPEARLPATETPALDDARPFEPPLRLRTDSSKTTAYRPRLGVDYVAPVYVGIADDGTVLSSVGVSFADLLGDHRLGVFLNTVSDFSNTAVIYTNAKRRLQWGAMFYDFRDYYVSSGSFGDDRQQAQRSTGADFFINYPFNRYYRFEASTGFTDTSQDVVVGYGPSGPVFAHTNDRFAKFGVSFVGDTTRYAYFGPFQGKRFSVGTAFAKHLSGDVDGDILQYNLDFRAYGQVTRRSLFAFRLAAIYGAGDREVFYGLGGINELRGYDFREFFGSRVVFANLEYRFPFIDEVRFPIGPIRDIRGFFFLDAGAAWQKGDLWYDPELLDYRLNVSGPFVTPVGFEAWDSENDRLQDLRASYGYGFQFVFIGGLQLNWAWSHRMPYTRYVDVNPDPFDITLQKIEGDSGKRMDFYIVFDF